MAGGTSPKILKFNASSSMQYFFPNPELAAGYTNYEVVVIGGAGGGGYSGPLDGTGYYYGAGGGGGASKRITGLLSDLPGGGVEVQVGTAGAEAISPGTNSTQSIGTSGNPSTFNATGLAATTSSAGTPNVARATGGGFGASAYNDTNYQATGKQHATYVGYSGYPDYAFLIGGTSDSQYWGADGPAAFNGNEGYGGFGDTGVKMAAGTAKGGRGSYAAGNTAQAGIPVTGDRWGGGAKLPPIFGDNTHYGSKAAGANPNGIVAIRLT